MFILCCRVVIKLWGAKMDEMGRAVGKVDEKGGVKVNS